MRAINKLRAALEADIFTEAELQIALGSEPSRYSTVSRLVRSGDLVRLRRGFYAFGSLHRNDQLLPFSIANTLYGPSYVSLESMLSFHGFIPETVLEVTSVNTKKTKSYTTPVGRFRYRIIPSTAFPYGVRSYSLQPSRFLGATKEKAILDTLYLSGAKEHLLYLTESLRIEHEELALLERRQLQALAHTYNNQAFRKRINKLAQDLKL